MGVLTGKRLSDDIAVTLFSMGGYVFSCLSCSASRSIADAGSLVLEFAAVCAWARPVRATFCAARESTKWRSRQPTAFSWEACIFLRCEWCGQCLAVAPGPGRSLPRSGCGIPAALRHRRRPCLHSLRLLPNPSPRSEARPGLVEFARLALPLAVAGVLIGWYNYSGLRSAGVRHPPSSGSSRLRRPAAPGGQVAVYLYFLYYLLVCRPTSCFAFPSFN